MTKGYVVWLIPKNKDVKERVLRPNALSVSWSKKRAEKELYFFIKTAKFSYDKNYSMTYQPNELYRFKIITFNQAKKLDLV